MANCVLNEAAIKSIARKLLPGCRPNVDYQIAWDDFRLQVNFGEEVTTVLLPKKKLMLSWDDFAEWLKGELPPEWFPKPADLIDFDATG